MAGGGGSWLCGLAVGIAAKEMILLFLGALSWNQLGAGGWWR
jgi:hypothetical protein